MSERDSVEEVLATIRERVDPDESERRRLQSAASDVVSRAESAVTDLDVDADVLQVGSTARGTWVSGDRDIDVFVRFAPSLSPPALERLGLQVGNRVLPEGREEYADHPYVTGEYEGFDVDLVPCYRVDSPADIESPVDRTPFHNQYLASRIDDDTAGDVRLFKQFLKGIGAYGSNLQTRGFSGYLTELLVLEYGDFVSVLDAAETWHPPIRLDPAGHGRETFDDPLVVIDPTDPERNVAAVVAKENVARLQHHARAFLDDPTVDTFEPDRPAPLSRTAVEAHLERRDTVPIAVRFDPPDVVADQLYPQLRKSLDGLIRALEGHDFPVVRGAVFAQTTAVLFVELAVATLPAIERHDGPPVHVSEHAGKFLETYADGESYGPFIDGDRYVVERERDVTDAGEFVERRLLDVALGAQVESALESEYQVLDGPAVGMLAAEFGAELADYFNPTP